MERGKIRGISIRAKILFPTSVVIILLCVVMGTNSYRRTKEGLVAMGVEEAQMAAIISTKVIDGEQVAELSAEKSETAEYKALLESMYGIKKDCGIKYLYTLYTDGDKVYYGIDADESENVNDYGSVFAVSYQELKPVFEGEMYVQDYIDSTDDGDLITAYMPLVDSSGNVIGIVGCDYDAAGVVKRLHAALERVTQISLICLMIALLLLNFVVSKVIKSLRKVDGKIYELVHNEGDLTQSLDVHTGDEMEVIAKNVNGLLQHIRKIMLNIRENSENLKESSRTVSDRLSNAETEISDVSSVMEQMSAAMEESSASLDQINESIRQIFQAIESIYRQAREGSDFSDGIKKTASDIYNYAVKENRTLYFR